MLELKLKAIRLESYKTKAIRLEIRHQIGLDCTVKVKTECPNQKNN